MVKTAGPWSVAGCVLVLEDWRKNLWLSKTIISRVMIWMCLWVLPFDYWDRESILEIGTTVGRPVAVDACTEALL